MAVPLPPYPPTIRYRAHTTPEPCSVTFVKRLAKSCQRHIPSTKLQLGLQRLCVLLKHCLVRHSVTLQQSNSCRQRPNKTSSRLMPGSCCSYLKHGPKKDCRAWLSGKVSARGERSVLESPAGLDSLMTPLRMGLPGNNLAAIVNR